MYPTGHYGVALLVTSPFVPFLGRRAGTVFSTFVLLTALLPDLDRHVPYTTHHGVTHTFLFAAVSAVAVGTLAGVGFYASVAVRGTPRANVTTRRAVVWATAGVFLGVASHVVADVLVLLPGTQPVSPFWPVFDRRLHVEVIPLGAPVRNVLLLAGGFVAQALAFRRA